MGISAPLPWPCSSAISKRIATGTLLSYASLSLSLARSLARSLLLQENGLVDQDHDWLEAVAPPAATSDDPLSLAAVMRAIISAFEDRDKKVRKAALGVYVAVWRRVGTARLQPFVAHLKPTMLKALKAKTEGKATSADTAGSDGVEDGGIMFFNAEENNTGSGAASTADASGAPPTLKPL
eukprot:COSAG05_NODE_2326_length_3231_cov_38.996096_3_plen_181_part_00